MDNAKRYSLAMLVAAFIVAIGLSAATQVALAEDSQASSTTLSQAGQNPSATYEVLTLGGQDESTTTPSGATRLTTQAVGSSYESPDGIIGVYGKTAGTVSYNASTKTLTLTNVTAETIGFRKTGAATIKLVGTNSADVRDRFGADIVDSKGWSNYVYYDSGKGSATITGTGSLSGEINIEGDLTIQSGTITANSEYSTDITCAKYTQKGGKVTTKGQYTSLSCDSMAISNGSKLTAQGISCEGAIVVSNGTIAASSLHCDGAFTMKNGTLTGSDLSCKSFTLAKGTVKLNTSSTYGEAIWCTGGFTIKDGKIAAQGISCGNYVQKGGTVGITAKKTLYCHNFTMTKGSLTINNADTGISVGKTDHKTYTMKVSGGTVKIANPSNYGISGNNCNFTMTGGTVAITKSYGYGMWMYSTKYRGKTYGGKVRVTGGKLTATVRKPTDYSSWAIRANSMSNKAACLKSIKGRIPAGASFKVAGNEFKNSDTYSQYAALTKYGSKSTKPKFNTVKYGGISYTVNGIGAKAFNTKAGKKVKSITFKNSLKSIGAKAFYGTKSLTNLNLNIYADEKHSSGTLKSISFSKEVSVSKTAFAKAGKSGGSGLTVKLPGVNSYSYYEGHKQVTYSEVSQYKTFLKRYGLPSSAKVAELRV